MKIGEIAHRARVSESIIRYYEQKGVLPRPIRDSCGYRDYGDSDLTRIRLVTGARRLGCSFGEIQNIIAIQENEAIPTLELLEWLEHKVVEVGNEIDRLRCFQTELSRLHDHALKLARD